MKNAISEYVTWITVVLLVSPIAITAVDRSINDNCLSYQASAQRDHDEYMDTNADPCNDFYEYACGNWRVPYRLRSLGARDTLTLIRALNKQLLMQHLQKTDDVGQRQSREITGVSGINDFYNSCLSVQLSGVSRDTIQVYTEVLRQFSVWPVLDATFAEQAANASFNWEHVSAQLRRYGAQSFWRLLVQSNWQAAEQRIFYIVPPVFDLLKADEQAFMYQRYIKYLLLDLGIRVRKANSIADEVVTFERELQALSSVADHTQVLREPQTLSVLSREIPDLRLLEYFNTLLKDVPNAAASMEQMLIVADAKYLTKLTAFLQKTKANVIGKYLLVQFLSHFEVHMHENKSYNEQREHCLHQLNNFMPHELSRLYLWLLHGGEVQLDGAGSEEEQSAVNTAEIAALTFMRDTQFQLNEHFEGLKQQFEQALNISSIFESDEPARANSLEKLRAMRLILPTLEDIKSSTLLTVNISDSYDQTLLRLSQSQALAEFRQVTQSYDSKTTIDRSSWHDLTAYGPLDITAYYRLKKNAIVLPVGSLRPPMWHRCISTPRLYGGIAYVIAHEMLHGFDYDGFNYDKAGNVANNWAAKSIIKYGTRSGCYLGPRYSNATQNINENIADSEGLRLAYDAFRARATGSATPQSTDDLKALFLAFAQTWCGQAVAASHTTQHASHRERVNNVLANFPEFGATFQCKPHHILQAEDKCRIW